MKSKRDRRPLLTQEAPVLSDQMPHGTVGEGEQQSQTINQSQKEQQQFQQQQEQTKKCSWKRLFGKGGGVGGGGGGSKRKEGVHSRYTSISEGEGKAGDTGSNNEFNPIVVDQSYLSTFEDLVENSQQQQQQQGRLQSIDKQSSPRVSDKRDDVTESSQSIMSGVGVGGEPIKQQQDLKNNGNNNINRNSTSPAAAQTPTSTASNISGRNKNRFTSIRSSSKRMTPKVVDQLSPSLSSVMASGSITSPTSSAGGNDKRPTTTTTSNSYQQQHENAQPQPQQLWSSTTTTPMSNKMISSTVVDTDVKKILSKPFGREHILMTEQTVSLKNNGSMDIAHTALYRILNKSG